MGGKPVFAVPSKTVINFKSGFKEKLLCDGPTFSAGTSCQYSCSFCYVPAAMKKQEAWLKEHGVTGKHEDIVIRRENAVDIARKQLMSRSESERMTKKVIYASPLVDVAANMELVKETVEICKVILELTNWDIRLLSKSNLLPRVAQALGEWWNLDDHDKPLQNPNERIIYGVSTGTLDDKLAKAFEEGCPLVSKRIQSLHWLQDNGFRTFGMICPSLPQLTVEAYEDFAEGIAKAIRVDHCEHVWAEVINVRGDSFTRTIKALNDAHYYGQTAELTKVNRDKEAWEEYSRFTFLAHTHFCTHKKLRFLQYVTKDTLPWWKEQEKHGAVLLGPLTHT
jgi:DNA repair photolyase